MSLGARRFFTHFISPFVQTCAILGRCLPKECARMRPGLCHRRPGIFYIFYFTCCAKLCDFGSLFAQRMCPHASGVMPLGAQDSFTHFILPACVRGYVVRRPEIFYTFHFTFCANLCDFGSLFAQRMCPHASGVMP